MNDITLQLPNRVDFFNQLTHQLQAALSNGQPLGLIVIHLRRLREINTQIGYQAGDQTITHIANRISQYLRPIDITTKIGGNELAIILPALSSDEQLTTIAADVAQACAKPFKIAGHQVKLRTEMGIAMAPLHANDAQSLLQCADIAVAINKNSGRNYTTYTEIAHASTTHDLSLESELDHAIEHHGLMLHYQPKVDLDTLNFVGVEALCRWTSPKHGPVSPETFIRIAEKSGLILPLTHWVLNTALRQYREHQDSHATYYSIAINLSATLLNSTDIVDLLTQAIRRWGIRPSQLILEMTESAIMADPQTSLEILMLMHELGMKISIDDFGTGYSSLTYLSKFPVDEIKIDKSFVMNMIQKPSDAQIVQTVIDLAHNFNLNVVAEGVENENILKMLVQMGCESAQGFCIARPISMEALKDWLITSSWNKTRG